MIKNVILNIPNRLEACIDSERNQSEHIHFDCLLYFLCTL